MMREPSSRVWAVALGLSVGPAVANGFARFAYGLILPAMREDLAWTYTQAGWINTANAIGYLLGALLAFWTIARLGAARLFLSGILVTAVALIASGMTRDFWLLTIWRVLAGVGGAPVFIAGGTLASALFKDDPGRNALAIAIYFGGGGLGMLISGAVLPLMLHQTGSAPWPQAWLMLGLISVVSFIPAFWSIRAMPASPRRAEGSLRPMLPLGAMAWALLGYSLFAVGYIVYLTFLVAWMRTKGAEATLISLTWSLMGIAVMASPFPWRRVVKASSGGKPLALACAGTGVATLLPIFWDDPVGIVLSAAMFGLSFFIAPTAVTSFSRKNLPEAAWGASVAVFTTAFALGQIIGPVAAGVIADRSNSISSGLAAAGVTLLIAAILSGLQRPLTSKADSC